MNLTLFLSAISLLCLGLQFAPFDAYAIWDVQSISQGQWWRILTGNFTHTNFAHLGMNIAGLWVISFIFRPSVKILGLCLIMLGITVGLCNLLTDIHLYVGLSGVLHGLFAYFAIIEALQGRKSSWLLVGGLLVKIIWEQWFGASASTSEMIGAKVAIEAHLSGSLGGSIFGALHFYLTPSHLKKH